MKLVRKLPVDIKNYAGKAKLNKLVQHINYLDFVLFVLLEANLLNRLNKLNSTFFKIMVILLPVIVVFLIYFFRDALIFLGTKFPACPSYTYLHVYCPGCGNTRSVQHLLSGDITGSIRYNPVPIFGIILILLAYIELLCATFKKHVKLVPRSKRFWAAITAFFIIYFVIRNFIKIF